MYIHKESTMIRICIGVQVLGDLHKVGLRLLKVEARDQHFPTWTYKTKEEKADLPGFFFYVCESVVLYLFARQECTKYTESKLSNIEFGRFKPQKANYLLGDALICKQ